jgi:CRP/FNR family transcriptional regulator, cyclic AMP receptor protein
VERAEASGGVVALLDWDPDLAQDLGQEDTRAARAELLARAETIGWRSHRGPWGPRDPRAYFGFLVLEGRLLREVQLPRGGSAELLGVGDLLRPWDVDGGEFLPIETTVEWTVLSEVTVAVLDGEFVRRAARWPPIVSRLSGRAVLRAKGATLNQAISHLRHVESRLLLLFWHFAERWGKVGPDVISIDLALTHEVLGKLVGATRPSVTTALSQLSDRGLLVRVGGVWRVSHDSAGELRRFLGDGLARPRGGSRVG